MNSTCNRFIFSILSLTQTHTHIRMHTDTVWQIVEQRQRAEQSSYCVTCSPKPSNDIHKLRGGATAAAAALLLAAISHTLQM